ncbi:MAG: hypothetical protein RL722_2267 [Pseudomonadota bacterium]|jgi:tRNA modification GTPase
MLHDRQDPIVAIATAPGRGAVGIVRVSAAQSLQPLAEQLCGRALRPRLASFGPFLDAQGQPIDHGLALHFPSPHSYTGEHVLELQAHGGPIVLQLLLARCLAAAATPGADGQPCLPRLRLAEPGEFTERAFLNNKLDLAQAEAVADLIDAGTEAAARSAARALGGAFSREVERLRDGLIELRALVEATLDFPEEEIDFLREADATRRLAAIAAQLATVRTRARQGALLREGLTVVIAGQPNAGKSSLLNALAGAELAIVTAVPGTTRDRISQTIQIEGVPLHVIDTAGLREDSADEVERIGIERSWQAIAEADVLLFLHDLTRADEAAYLAAEAAIAARLAAHAPTRRLPRLHVFNKQDASPPEQARHATARLMQAFAALGEAGPGPTDAHPASAPLQLSARSGAGLEALRQALLRAAGWQALGGDGIFIARARHVQALEETGSHLDVAQAHITSPAPALELLAEELRLAHDSLGRITGAYSADALLGDIFGRFCIGK